MKFTILTILSVQLSSVENIYVVVKPVSRTFCKNEIIYSLNNFAFPPPTKPLATTILFSISRNLTTLDTLCKWNHAVSFVTGLFQLAYYPQGSSELQYVSECLSFLRLNNIPLSVYTTFCLSIHPWMDT